MKDKRGFTLVELLIVVSILAFLLGIIVIAASNTGEDAKKKSMYASLKSVKTALEVYWIQYGVFPSALSELVDIEPIDQRLIDVIPDDIFKTTGPVSYELFQRTYAAWSVGPNLASPIEVGDDKWETAPDADDIFVTNIKDAVYKP